MLQALERSLESAINKANQALDPSDSVNVTTADDLESLADELQKAVESVVSAGLSKSHPLVVEATELDKSMRDKATETKVRCMWVQYVHVCVGGPVSS